MTQQESLNLTRQLLKARDHDELARLMALHLSTVDGTFFKTAEAVARQLEHEGKPSIATALRNVSSQMLRMKTLI